jgi:hypothetical protein
MTCASVRDGSRKTLWNQSDGDKQRGCCGLADARCSLLVWMDGRVIWRLRCVESGQAAYVPV